MPLSETIIELLQCPSCTSPLAQVSGEFICRNASCGARYPVVDGVPIFVRQEQAAIPARRFVAGVKRAADRMPREGSVHARIAALTPSIRQDGKRRVLLARLLKRLDSSPGNRPPAILAIGPRVSEMQAILASGGAEVVHLGVTPFSTAPDLLSEFERLPFRSEAFDAVVVQGALHRTLSPAGAVNELQRILRPEGLVWVEEPFMDAVQEGPYDFFRFSHLGLKAMFSWCRELDSGVVDGTGSALASSWRHYLWSLSRSHRAGFLLATLGSFTSFFWKYTDARLEKQPHAFDAAASVFFFGRRSTVSISASEVIAGYRGGAAPYQRPSEARPATEVFTEWAATDRDRGMEKYHAVAVDEMLSAAFSALGKKRDFTAIDAGCGNGWIVRRLAKEPGCRAATGVDGSAGMIAKARAIDPSGRYVLADLASWQPPERVDLVVSMEVLYYFDDPVVLLRRIANEWLKPGGYAIFGIDHYEEREDSLRWPEGLGVRMTTWPEARWLSALDEAGFIRARTWQAAAQPGEAGTLAMLVRTPGG